MTGTTKLSDAMSVQLSYNDSGKKRFSKVAVAALKALADEMGLQKGEYDVRYNAGGIAVSGEATLHADWIYVQVGQSVLADLGEIMFRTCKGRKDYTGGQNHFAPAVMLDPENVAEFARKLLTLKRG